MATTNPPAEMLLESLLVLLLETGHVVRHVETEDVLPVHIRVQLLALGVVTRESLLGVRDVQTTVHCSLQRGKHLDKIIIIVKLQFSCPSQP